MMRYLTLLFVFIWSILTLRTTAFVFQKRWSTASPFPSKLVDTGSWSSKVHFDTQLNLALRKTDPALKPKSNLVQRTTTGLVLAAAGLVFLYSPKNVFTSGLSLITVVALNEYNRILNGINIHPSMTLGALIAFASAFTAAYKFKFHSLVMPVAASVLLLKMFLSSSKLPTISEVSSEFFGWFYVAFLPTYWILLKFLPPSVLSTICRPEMFDNLDRGFLLTFFSMATVAFSDIGAYFAGRLFGRHKLSHLSKAAGEASPNKTLEGACGGILSGCAVSLLGAYLMSWPHWPVTGLLYGVMLSVVGIVGDLTASLMKRDAGVKDSGNLLPGHGGILDRVDSYILTAPLAFAFCRYFLPQLVADANW